MSSKPRRFRSERYYAIEKKLRESGIETLFPQAGSSRALGKSGGAKPGPNRPLKARRVNPPGFRIEIRL
jgi:hypothetical protein